LGYGDKPRRLARRSERGHVARLSSKRAKKRGAAGLAIPPKPGCEPKRFVREIRGAAAGLQVGQELTVGSLAETQAVDVTGLTKGRGFAGVIKRHHFSGQRASHGVKKVHRHPGGTGSSATPSRVFKGRRMAGRYGNVRATIRNLKVVRIDQENGLLLVRGAVPGPNGGLLVIRETNKLG
jgi:large subunit ribosomal protein L3